MVLYAVILAGGRGERFWPWSRAKKPKQLLPIAGTRNMLEETVERISPAIPEERISVVTSEDLAPIINKSCPWLKEERIIAEPCGRNTAAAVGLAAITLRGQDPRGVMAVLSADHQIDPQEKFLDALSTAAEYAQRQDCLVTFGIPPSRPETGYGYIELGEQLADQKGGLVYRVRKFKEKPTRVMAQQFYLDKNFLWNSGMFVWKVETILQVMAVHMPDLHRGLEEIGQEGTKRGRADLIHKLYERIPSVSIDVGIMEKADNVVVIQGDFRWDDVGTWSALRRIHKPDKEGNVILGKGLAVDSFECILAAADDGIIATLGVSDLIVARTSDCVLVAHSSRAEDLRKLVEKLGEKKEFEKYL